MKNEIARREVESLDYYLQNHTDDYSEESHTAMMMAMDALNKADAIDEIRAEIEQNAYPIVHGVNNHEKGMSLYGILQIIDKYRGDKK